MQDAVKIEPSREALKPTMSLSGQKDMSLASSSSSSSEVSSSSSSSFLDAFVEAAATMSSLSSPSSDFSSSSPVEDDSESGDEEEEDEYDEDDDNELESSNNNNESESRKRAPPSSLKAASQNKFAPGQIQGALSSSSLPPKLAPKVTSLLHKTPDAGDSSEAFKRAIEKRRYTKRGRRRKLDPEITNLLSTFLREKTAAGVLYTQADVITFVKEVTKGEVVLSNVDVTRYTQRLGFNRRDKPRPAPSSLPPPVPIGPPIAPRVSPRVPFPPSSSPSSGPVSTPAQQKTNQRTTRSSVAATTSSSSPSLPVQSPTATVSHRPSRHSQPPQRSLSSTSHERAHERHQTVGPVSPPSHHVHRPGYYPDVSADPLVYAAQQQQQQQQLKAYQDYQAHQYMQMMYQHMVHQQMQEMERFQQQQQEQMHLAAQRMAEARHSQSQSHSQSPVPSFPNRHYPAPEAPVHFPEQRGPFVEPRVNERVETTAPVAERPLWKPQKKVTHRLPSHLPSTSSLPMAPVSVKRASSSQPPLPSVRHLLDALAPHVSYC